MSNEEEAAVNERIRRAIADAKPDLPTWGSLHMEGIIAHLHDMNPEELRRVALEALRVADGSDVKMLTLTTEMYNRLLVCLRFCIEDLGETEGFLEASFAEATVLSTNTPEKRTTLPKVQQLQRAVERNTQEGVLET
jgi:hypothetical protein